MKNFPPSTRALSLGRSLAAFFLLAPVAFAQTAVWLPGGTGSWNTGSRWSTGAAPGATTNAVLANAGIAELIATFGQVNNLEIGANSGSTGTLLIGAGGGLGSLGTTLIGNSAGAGTVTVSAGGIWTTTSSITVGNTGAGTLNLRSDPTGDVSTISLEGGAGAIIVGASGSASGVINIGAAVGNASVKAGNLLAGSITGGAGTGQKLVNFNHTSNDYTFTPVLAGSLAVAHNGANSRTILTAANTYTGNTAVNAGTLTLTNTTASPTFTIASSATLEFNVDSGTRNNPASTTFTGTGTFRKTGDGTLRWDNSVVTFALGAGSTIDVQGGTLVGGSFGNDVWTNNLSHLNVAAGALFTGSQANVRVAALTGSGRISSGYIGAGYTAFTFGLNDASGTFAGELIDYDPAQNFFGNFIKAGTGTQILTGTNTFTGTLTVDAGTLRIGNGGATGSITTAGGNISNNGTLIFDRDNSAATSLARVVSGTGALIKAGTGTLTLTGANTYTGTTTLSGGTLVAGSATALGQNGNLTFSGGTLQFSAPSAASDYASRVKNSAIAISLDTGGQNVTWAGQLDGTNTGGLTKLGSGTLTLSGENIYSGNTAVQAGTLVLQNTVLSPVFSIASGATVELNVAAGTRNNPYATTFTGTGSLVKTGAGLMRWDNSVVTFALNAGSTIDVQAGTLVGGSFGNDVWTNNLSHLNVAAGALFTGSQANVRVAALTGSGRISSGYIGAGYTAFTFGLTDSSGTFAGELVDYDPAQNFFGNFIKTGTGTQILTGANTYTGTTTISGGTLQIGSGGTSGSLLSSAIANQGALVFNRSDASTFAGALTGTGTLTKLGAGTLTLSGANASTGATTISAGTLQFARQVALYNNLPGNWTAEKLTVASGATAAFNVGGVGEFTAANLNFLKTLGTATGGFQNGSFLGLDTTNATGGTFTYAGTLANPNGGAHALGLTKLGSGTLILSGTNSYTGVTTIRSGTLQIGDGGTTGALLTSAIANQGTLAFNRADALTHTGVISGTGAVTQLGAGTLTLSGPNTYSGGTTLAAGTLAIANDAALGHATSTVTFQGGTLASTASLASARAVTLGASGGAFAPDTGTTLTWNGLIGGTGALTQSGAGTLKLTGANTYAGGTRLNAGTLSLASDTALGAASGAVTLNGGTLASSTTFTSARTLTLEAGGGGLDTATGTTLTWQGEIGGTGTLAKLGAGTLVLTGANPFTGLTTINTGTLQIGDGGTTGSLTGSAIINQGALVFNRTDASAHASAISGSGTLTKLGSGTLTLSGAHTYTGTTTISAGTLQFAQQNSLYNNTSANWTAANLTVAAGATAAFNVGGTGEFTAANLDAIKTLGTTTGGFQSGSFLGIDTTNAGSVFNYAGNLANPNAGANTLGLVKLGTGTLRLTGTATHTGGTFVNGGTLQLANTSGIASGAFVVNAGGTLAFERNDVFGTHTTTPATTVTINAGGLVTSVADSPIFNTLNNLTLNGGELRADRGQSNVYTSFQLKGTVTVGGTTASTITTTGAANSEIQLGNNTNTGVTTFAVAEVTGDAAADLTISAVLQDGRFSNGGVATSGLRKTGAGTLTLSGANTYTGTTTIAEGTLRLAGSANLAGNNVVNEGTLVLDRSNNFTLGATISGAGSLTHAGAGITTLTGNHTYTGVTTINAGTLRLSSGASLYSNGTTAGSVIVNDGGTLSFARSNSFGTHTATPVFTLTINEGGLVTNTGFSTFTTLNNLTLNGGELRAGGGESASYGAFQLKGTVTVGGATASAITTTGATNSGIQLGNNTTDGVTTFAVADVTGDAASDLTISAILQNGRNAGETDVPSGLTKTGAGTLTLSGANTFTGVTTIAEGTLVLGVANALGQSMFDSSGAGTLSFGTLSTATLSGLTGTGALALVNQSANALTLTVGGNNTSSTYSGVLSGAGSLRKAGTGTLTLTGNNTYTGGTTLAGGLVEFSSLAQFGTGAVTIAGGGLRWATGTSTDVSSRLAALGTGGATFNTNGNDVTFASALTGTGSFTKTGAGTLTLSADNTYTGTTTLSTGTLRLGDGGTTGSVAGAIANQGALILERSDNFTLANAISGSGSLTQAGSGTVTLTANNSFSGVTTLNAGTLVLGVATALGQSTLDTSGAGALSFGALSTATLGGLTGTGALALVNQSANAVALTVGGNNATTTYSGALSGPGSLRKEGTGTLTLSGNNTYTGGTTLAGGLVEFSSLAQFGSGAVTLNGGGLRWAAGASTDVSSRLAALGASGGTFNTNGNDVSFGTALTGTGSFTKTGAGTLTLTSDNTHTGTTRITGGTLHLGSSGALASSILDLSGGGSLSFSASFTEYSLAGLTGSSGSLTLANSSGGALALLVGASNLSSSSGAGLTGSGSLVKVGTGILTLTGNNRYTGTTTVNGGTLRLSGTGSLYNNGLAAGAIIINSGGTLDLARSNAFGAATDASAVTVTINAGGLVTNSGSFFFNTLENLTLNGGELRAGTGSSSLLGSYRLRGTVTVGGTTASAITTTGGASSSIQLGDNTAGGVTTFAVANVTGDAASDLTISTLLQNSYNGGTIASGLTKTGAGTLTLTAANTFTGVTTINEGTLVLGVANALGQSTFDTASAGTLSLGSFSAITFGGLSGSGAFSLVTGASEALALTVGGNNTSTTYSGVFSGTGSLRKVGTGVLTLTADNTYSGSTTIAGGLVEFSSLAQFGSGTVTLDGGGLRWATGTTTDVFSRLTAFGAGGGTFNTNGNDLTLDAALTGTGGFTKAGTGTLTFTTTQAYAGATRVTGGTLHLAAGSSLGQSALDISGGGSLTFASEFTEYSLAGLGGSSGSLTLANSGGDSLSLLVGANNSSSSTGGKLTGSGSLTKVGTGTLTLSGSSDYQGLTTINGGTLRLFGSGSLYNNGLLPGSIIINSGGTLELARTDTFGNHTTARATAITVNTGGLLINSGNTFNTFANLTLNGGELRAAAGSGSTYMAVQLKGTVTVSGTSASTITTTGEANSQIQLGNNLTGGVTTFAVADVTGNASTDLTISASLQNGRSASEQLVASGLAKTGAGTLTLSGLNDYSGGTTLSAGTLAVSANANLGDASGVVNFGGGTLQTTGTFAAARATTLNAGGGSFETTGATTLTWSGAISGTGPLTKLGTGTLILTTTNTYTGGTTLANGTLSVGTNAHLGATSGAITFDGGTLRTTGTFTATRATTLNAGGGSFETTGATTLTWNGTIAGAGTLTKLGTGTLVLGGANTYSGATTVNAGTLRLGTATALSGNTTLHVAAGATFHANGFATTFTGLTGTGAITLGSGALTVKTSASAPSSFGGTLTGTGALTVNGGGKLTLAGNSATTFTGATTVTNATLSVTGSLAGSAVTLGDRGYLSGSGTIGALTLAAGSTLAPGNSPGTLHAGTTTWHGGSTYEWEINNATAAAGTGYDLLSISTGILTLAATSEDRFTLKLTSLLADHTAGEAINFNSAVNSSYTIASAAGGIFGFNASAFTINASGFTNAAHGGTWSLSLGNSNRDLNLNFTAAAIPEPSTYAALAGALALLGAIQRRRRNG